MILAAGLLAFALGFALGKLSGDDLLEQHLADKLDTSA